MLHSCIKCTAPYEDEQEDPYYCSVCLVIKNEIAQKIDAKIKTVGQQPSGMLQQYDALSKGQRFVNAKSLGL